MYEHITLPDGMQGVVDKITGNFLEILQDDKYPWRERKVKTLRLADVYEAAGMPDYALRARTCSTWLEYFAMSGGERQLHHFNACQLRLCPNCTARKAKQTAFRLSKVLNLVVKEHPGTQYIFLTLTVQNCLGNQLSQTIELLLKSFHKLMRNRKVQRAVKGWFRALEITRDPVTDTYHPHFHVILAVEPEYFKRSSGLYIKQSEWVDRWQRSLGVAYKPSVRIQKTKAKQQAGKDAAMAAATEAAKYATKDSEYIDTALPIATAAEVVKTYTNALRGRRLLGMGGWLKEAASALDLENIEDGDLVHLDDNEIREDLADLIETYGWHFGAGDYVLQSRVANPAKQE